MLRATGIAMTLSLALGCMHVSDAIESACIKGRISEAQAQAINERPWSRNPGYCRGNSYTDDEGEVREGESHCRAEPDDRVLAAHCAAFSRIVRSGD